MGRTLAHLNSICHLPSLPAMCIILFYILKCIYISKLIIIIVICNVNIDLVTGLAFLLLLISSWGSVKSIGLIFLSNIYVTITVLLVEKSNNFRLFEHFLILNYL